MTPLQVRHVDEFLSIVRRALVEADALPAMLVAIPADQTDDGLHILAVGTLDRAGQAKLAAEALLHLTQGVPVLDKLHGPERRGAARGGAQDGGKDGAA